MWKILYWELSVMNLSTFLVYSSDRIKTVSFSIMLMEGVLPFVASMLALPREPTTHHPLVQRQFVQVQTKPVSMELRAGATGRPRGSDIDISKCKWLWIYIDNPCLECNLLNKIIGVKVNGRRGGKDDWRIIKEMVIQYRIVPILYSLNNYMNIFKRFQLLRKIVLKGGQ